MASYLTEQDLDNLEEDAATLESFFNEHFGSSKFLVPIVGNYYRNTSEQKYFRDLRVGSILKLSFEPSNKFDRNAVKVLSPCGKIQIGWLSKSDAADLTRIFDYIIDDVDFQHCRYTSHGFRKSEVTFEAKVKSLAKTSFERTMIEITNVSVRINSDPDKVFDPKTFTKKVRRYENDDVEYGECDLSDW